MVKRTEAELEALKTKNGGYNRATLKMLGVPWPPPKAWRQAVLNGDPIPVNTTRAGAKKMVPMAEFVAKYGTGHGCGSHTTTCTATACTYPECGCLT